MKKYKSILFFLFLVAAILGSGSVNAQQYRVTAKRVSSNLYKITEGNLLVVTSLCLNLALMDPAILSSTEIRFIQDRDDCMVRGIYAKASMKSGTYSVNAMSEVDDFHFVGNNTYVLTWGCPLLLPSAAVLKWNGSSGTLSSKGQTCRVEDLYVKTSL